MADAIPAQYRGAKMVLYIDNSTVPADYIKRLVDRGAMVIQFNPKDLKAQGWNFTVDKLRLIRYWAVNLPDYDYVLFRDLDSGLYIRETAAVYEFLDSEMDFHSMRDTPFHYFPLMGGMWGLKRSALARLPFNFTDKMKNFLMTYPVKQNEEKWTDQFFLRDIIYPHSKEYTMTHDSYFCDVNKYGYLATKVRPCIFSSTYCRQNNINDIRFVNLVELGIPHAERRPSNRMQ